MGEAGWSPQLEGLGLKGGQKGEAGAVEERPWGGPHGELEGDAVGRQDGGLEPGEPEAGPLASLSPSPGGKPS